MKGNRAVPKASGTHFVVKRENNDRSLGSTWLAFGVNLLQVSADSSKFPTTKTKEKERTERVSKKTWTSKKKKKETRWEKGKRNKCTTSKSSLFHPTFRKKKKKLAPGCHSKFSKKILYWTAHRGVVHSLVTDTMSSTIWNRRRLMRSCWLPDKSVWKNYSSQGKAAFEICSCRM